MEFFYNSACQSFIIVLFSTQFVPDLASGSPFWVAPVSFSHVFEYFLSGTIRCPGSSCTLPAKDLESKEPWFPFCAEWSLETKTQAAGVHFAPEVFVSGLKVLN